MNSSCEYLLLTLAKRLYWFAEYIINLSAHNQHPRTNTTYYNKESKSEVSLFNQKHPLRFAKILRHQLIKIHPARQPAPVKSGFVRSPLQFLVQKRLDFTSHYVIYLQCCIVDNGQRKTNNCSGIKRIRIVLSQRILWW